MNVTNASKKDLETLPLRKWNEDIGSFSSLVIFPTKTKHDSGYRCMEFVAVKDDIAICRLSGCSDVLHIGGIMSKNIAEWKIDCLPKSGLLRLFCGKEITAGLDLSSFEIFIKGGK
jgi:hypothetical protein